MATPKTIKETVETNINHYIDHSCFNKSDNIQISIVMATHDRIDQTLFTLKTINQSAFKQLQVIIVDDSEKQFIDDSSLQSFPYQIDYIKIKKTRDWVNPCVNYNIAFSFVKGEKVIIQNGEVCHIGDVVSHVNEQLSEGKYVVFDVIACNNYNDNAFIKSLFPDSLKTAIVAGYGKKKRFAWYQHRVKHSRNYHFLSAIHINDLKKLGGFDYDYAMDRCFDDNDFIWRITNLQKLKIQNVGHLIGLHQYHDRVFLGVTPEQYKQSVGKNSDLYRYKIKEYLKKV